MGRIHDGQRKAMHATLQTLGRSATLQKVVNTTNPIDGTTDQVITEYTVQLYLARYKQEDMDGTSIREEDRRAWISGQDLKDNNIEAEENDRILVGTESWSIIKVHPYDPIEDPVVVVAQIRR